MGVWGVDVDFISAFLVGLVQPYAELKQGVVHLVSEFLAFCLYPDS